LNYFTEEQICSSVILDTIEENIMKVTWDENTCSHAGKCVQGSPTVFKVEDGKFVIDQSGASEDEIRNTVSQCPSGALTIED
jgi:uncharacterized Fe-S cluster protein YjdI